MKQTLFWLLALVIIVGGVWFFQSDELIEVEPVPIAQTPLPKLSPEIANDATQMIEVTAPTASAQVSSPLTVTGRARGPWYFEASFPIELRDSNGNILATTPGQAQGEWMTENWVQFTATLAFPAQPIGSTGSLILKNDNPSGEPQNEMNVVIPVQF